ncbi:hypothetical protein EVJ58_g7592, partial [Rhodofomes roseus]
MIAPPKPSGPLSPTQTLVDGRVPQKYSAARRYLLLLTFCLAQFLDAVNNSALFSAIPDLENSLGITEAESTWVISAFQLTFASFLLISGRISDVYNPKVAFTGGVVALGLISVGAGFAKDKIAIIILRALSGMAAAMTIPSALALLVSVFVEPNEQARALGLFGGCGAVGNGEPLPLYLHNHTELTSRTRAVLGLIIGGIFVQYANWSWVFWFVAIVAALITVMCLLLVPPQEPKVRVASAGPRWRALDLVGVSVLTAALILFIFAITSGSAYGWATAEVLVPLVISVLMVAAFFWYDDPHPARRRGGAPEDVVPPELCGLVWDSAVADEYGWSAISTAIHMIPIGVLAFSMSFTGPLARKINPKWIILFGESMLVVATILLAFADGPDKYWPFVFPAFVLGSGGAMLAYTHTNIAIFRTSPSSMAGTVGAIFNGALQLGSAVGIAAVDSLEESVQEQYPNTPYVGQRAVFWFLLGIVCIELVAMAIFYRTDCDLLGAEGKQALEGIDPEKMRDVDGKLADAEQGRGFEPQVDSAEQGKHEIH